MRTPPPIRTWGIPDAEIVIRQDRPITSQELYDHFDWRGMELWDGYLRPKGAGLSHEEIAADNRLCGAFEAKWAPILRQKMDDFASQKPKDFDQAFVISPAGATYNDTRDQLESGFRRGYREIWMFTPYHATVEIFITPRDHKSYQGGDILPGFELPIAGIFED